jgi:ACS family tartrate transporter-like MFS transporter
MMFIRGPLSLYGFRFLLGAAEAGFCSASMGGSGSPARHSLSVLQALFNPTVWQLGVLILLCNAFGVYGLGLWLPQVVRSLSGLSDFTVGVVAAVPTLVAAVTMVLVGAHSDPAFADAGGAGSLACGGGPAQLPRIVLAASVGVLERQRRRWGHRPDRFGGNLAGFVGPYVMGLLKGSSGSFQSGLLGPALASLAGAALALWLRRSSLLRAVA